MKILKQEKGSITLFVLIAMLFFVMYLVGMYLLSSNAETTGLAETKRIKEIYEQGIDNIDDVYATLTNEQIVNKPELLDGMVAIKWDGTQWVDTSQYDSEWYDYDETNKKWANARTQDGSMWVWIPRYAYKITYNDLSNKSSGGTIDIIFLKDTTNKDYKGNDLLDGYIVHPAFKDGSATHYMNGEWDEEITGFWVAKYEAGFQECTQTINDDGTITNPTTDATKVSYSTKKYTSTHPIYTTNALGQTLTEGPLISYPVFKPLTYSYNMISTGDSYTISREISKANNFYGLNSANSDSHMMKNSEWGAVAYLTQSKYGRNGTKLIANTKNLDNFNSKYIYAVTGYAGNTALGLSASSTNNVYGVFDLAGGAWEMVAGYITNGNDRLATYGASYIATTLAEPDGYKTLSTKYATVYPYDSSNDTDTNNWAQYNALKSNTYGYGDAILETSTYGNGTTSWNEENSYYALVDYPFFMRGGSYGGSGLEGTTAFTRLGGYSWVNMGFRVVLISK